MDQRTGKERADERAFRALVEQEPRLAEVEAHARATTDDGSASFFCSNYAWLPLQAELKRAIGVDRRAPGEAREGPLYDSSTYETAYVFLSGLLPPCRGCGCLRFEPFRGENEQDGAAQPPRSTR